MTTTTMTTMGTRTQRADRGRVLLAIFLGLGAASSGAFFSRVSAARWGESYGVRFARAASALVMPPALEEPEEPIACDPEPSPESPSGNLNEKAKAERAKSAHGSTILVPLSAVERASRSKHLRGEDVPERGVKIQGVSRFACGLSDGDVVISVGTLSKPTLASGTDYVLRALARGDRTVSAKVERAGRVWDVVVPVPEKFYRDRSQKP